MKHWKSQLKRDVLEKNIKLADEQKENGYLFLLLKKLNVAIACMLETFYQFRSKAGKRFGEINPLNEAFRSINLHALLRSGSIGEI